MSLLLSTISLLISHCLWVHPKYTWSRKDVGSPKSTSLLSTFPHRNNILFLSITLFWRCTNKHSQLETFSQPCTSIEFSQIAFLIIVLPKDDHTDFVQEERLGLRYWTMIYAICVVEDESKCVGIPVLEFSIILGHLPFLPGYKQVLRPLLVPRNLVTVWTWYPWLMLPYHLRCWWSLCSEYCIRPMNRLLQYRLESTTRPLFFGNYCLTVRHSSNDRCPSVTLNELLRPSFIASSITSDSLLTFVKSHAGSSLSSFSILYPLLPSLRVSSLPEAYE